MIDMTVGLNKKMDKLKRQRLENAGWVFGSVDEFLRLSKEESEKIDERIKIDKPANKPRHIQ